MLWLRLKALPLLLLPLQWRLLLPAMPHIPLFLALVRVEEVQARVCGLCNMRSLHGVHGEHGEHDDVALVAVEALVQDDDVHDDVVLAVEALVPACD